MAIEEYFLPMLERSFIWIHEHFSDHRIKVTTQVLTPLVLGLMTLYVAWQQKKISHDQRDIAQNKQRIEIFQDLYGFYESLIETYRTCYRMPHRLPDYCRKIAPVPPSVDIADLLDRTDIQTEKWLCEYLEQRDKADELIRESAVMSLKAEFMFQKDAVDAVQVFITQVGLFYEAKLEFMNEEIQPGWHDDDKRQALHAVKKHRIAAEQAATAMTRAFKTYINISDITLPSKKENSRTWSSRFLTRSSRSSETRS